MATLSELRVLDLSTEIAGPYCTKLFCDAGATVIKIENPRGDPLRRRTAEGSPPPDGNDGALFQFLNGGKKSAVLDIATPEGHGKLLDLAAGADLLIEDLGPGALTRLGLDFSSLKSRAPQLSVISISPWGQDGPWADRPATEWTLQAAMGMMARRGLPERGPVGANGRIAEWVAGSYASFGALVAWLSARRTGRGQHVDLSVFESLLQCGMPYNDLGGQFTGKPLRPYIDTPSLEPASDGWVGFATVTSQQWEDFCALVGRPEVGADSNLNHTDKRMQALPFIHEMIHTWTRSRTVDEIIEQATAMRIPVAPVGTGESLPQTDHFVERGVFQQHPGGFVQPRPPYRIGENPVAEPRKAPRLGEHTEETQPDEAPLRDRPLPKQTALPFEGLRVLDLTAFWAGPFLTGHLAMLGADVIKVESTHRPDGMRFVNAIKCDRFWEAGAIFHGANPDKRGITLRLDSPQGRELFLELVDQSDVLVENFSARVLPNLGLDPRELQKRNPRLIVVRMPSWGLDGPWRDRVGFAMNVEQACGIAWRSGYEDLPMIVNVCDPIGALHAFFALVLALENRAASGRGEVVEVPLVEPGLNIAAEQVIEFSAYGNRLTRAGNRAPDRAPQGVYRCRDGEDLALSIDSEDAWKGLCQTLGRQDWKDDERLGTAQGRLAHQESLDRQLSEQLSQESRDEIGARLRAAGVAAEPLRNGHYIMPHPQLEHRQFYQELDHEVVGRKRYPTLPMRFSEFGPKWHYRTPPLLGQHNQEILGQQLGHDEDFLQRLADEKIIGDRPAWR